MKFISWNVNGTRACVNKGFLEYFNEVIFVNSINVTRPYAKWNKDA